MEPSDQNTHPAPCMNTIRDIKKALVGHNIKTIAKDVTLCYSKKQQESIGLTKAP